MDIQKATGQMVASENYLTVLATGVPAGERRRQEKHFLKEKCLRNVETSWTDTRVQQSNLTGSRMDWWLTLQEDSKGRGQEHGFRLDRSLPVPLAALPREAASSEYSKCLRV